MILAFGFFSFFSFIFQLIMARMLSLSDYGILASLFSIIYILSVFNESVQTIITKFSTRENNKGKLKNLIKKSYKKAFKTSISLYLFYLIISIPLALILKINFLLLALNGLIIFFAFFIPITRGILQGKERFYALGANMIIESGFKLIFGIVFVYVGWKVYGAITGAILGGLFAFCLSFIPIREIMLSKEEKAETEGIYEYAKPAFIITFLIILFYSVDVLIAKIIFPSDVAGAYAISSTLAKIIFWGTLPISKAMFPMSAENNEDKIKSENVFFNSLLMILVCIFIILSLFYFFSESIVSIFSGREIPISMNILIYLGIAVSFISISNLILLYKLSAGKIRGYNYIFIFVLIEILLLFYFSNDVYQFSIAFITSSAVLLWGAISLVSIDNSKRV